MGTRAVAVAATDRAGPRGLCCLLRPCCLLLLVLVAAPARAENKVEVHGTYYREASTRIIQPMLQLTKDLPYGFDVGAHAIVDAVTSASVAQGASQDDIFTETRKEAGLRAGKTFGWNRSRVGAVYRHSAEPDYGSHTIGIEASTETGCPPVTIRGTGSFGAGRVEIDGGLSSQYVSALLMAAPFGHGAVDVALTGAEIGAKGYVDLTIAAMRAFGAKVERIDERTWRVEPTGYRATDHHIEPDASAATYLWAAEVLTGGRIDLGVPMQAFTQPDAKAAEFIKMFPHLPAVIDGSQMQDAVPTLAVLAAFNETPVRFVGIANLRVKECDRVSALSTELNRIREGLAHEEGDDLIVASDAALAGQSLPTSIHTYADHRIAMSFALAGLMLDGIVILDPGCVSKTYPGYWADLASLGIGVQKEFTSAMQPHL